MSTFKQFLDEQQNFDNWVFPSDSVINSDFSEYKKKEDRKWKSRANQMGFRFPIFNTKQNFKQALQSAQVVHVNDQLFNQIENLSNVGSLDQLRSLVSSYVRPRDVEQIVNGFENNDPIPYPIILKGTNGLHHMTGNTRINAARIFGITPKALIVDVSR